MSNKGFYFVSAFVAMFFHYGCVTAIKELGGGNFSLVLWLIFGGPLGAIIMSSVASMRFDAEVWRREKESNRRVV